jgi:anhydro-N-acetylmuramic acid kinase
MPLAKPLAALGLMSGTSMDGVDAALVVTDGERVERLGGCLTLPYAPAARARLRSVLGGAGDVAGAAEEITRIHAEAVAALLRQEGLSPARVDVIGFHGHTVLHRPGERRTWQIGDGALLARLTGIDVVDDFRTADVAAGGQGAPLVPLYHLALARGLERPLAVLNVGGVANVTWIGADDSLVAFDTGPGNALIDDWMARHTGEPFDRGGAAAARGRVHERALYSMLESRFFDRPAPKSLDRDDFSAAAVAGLSLEDGAATLTAFTAKAVALARDHFPAPARRWLVCGGGRHNPVLMRMLADALKVPVEPVEAVGWRGDSLEAEAFAFLAVRSLRALPLSLPSTTGAPRPMPGGRLHPTPRDGR